MPEEWFERITDGTHAAIAAGGVVLTHCHMGVNRAVLSRLLGRPLALLLDIPQAYAAVNVLCAGPQGLEVAAVNLRGESLPIPLSMQQGDRQ